MFCRWLYINFDSMSDKVWPNSYQILCELMFHYVATISKFAKAINLTLRSDKLINKLYKC